MTGDLLSDAPLVLAPMRFLIALWLILSCAQRLATATDYAPDGLLPWRALASQRRRPRVGRLRRLMSVPRLRAILLFQIVVALALAVLPIAAATIVCLGVLLAMNAVLIVLSGEYWAFGDTKIGMIAMAGALLVAIGWYGADPAIVLAGLLVAGGQLVLCYAVSGLSKLSRAAWRNGRHLQAAMTSEAWGHPLAGRLISYVPTAVVASWGVMLIEALFPLALLAPLPWLIGAMAVMLLFHIATAIVMGLNLFPWAFAAPYPAVLGLWYAIHAAT